jgi:hypothetical protein
VGRERIEQIRLIIFLSLLLAAGTAEVQVPPLQLELITCDSFQFVTDAPLDPAATETIGADLVVLGRRMHDELDDRSR